jgi:1-acyl-sn-glycerol-3-phosphate acyltransferase
MPPAPTSPTPVTRAVAPAAIPIERPSDEDLEPVTLDAETRRVPLPPTSTPEMIAEEIRQLEERLDRMIDEASRSKLPTADVPATPPPPSYPAPAPSARPAAEADTVFDTARELLSTDFYLRKWGRLGMRNRSEEVDDFGYDPTYEEKLRPFFDFLYERWFRVEPEGVEKIPAEGRCLLVANHSGTLPFDGVMLKSAVKRAHPKQRDVRWLAEDFIFHFPFLGAFSNRLGAVRACQENAERLLRQEALVAVFPEGVKGIGKLYRDRYKLQRFGRGGYIKLCLRTGTPIVPVAIVGAEETNPMLLRIEQFSKALGLPYIPVTPTFPALGPLGLIPAPTKWRILVGDPIPWGTHGPESADDEILVGRLSERVRATIQQMLDRAVAGRRSVWFG